MKGLGVRAVPPVAAHVVSVSTSASHSFSKPMVESIEIVKGLGVAGDAHQGRFVQHKILQWKNPFAKNLRQVHLMPIELIEELSPIFDFGPGGLGENVTTRGIDLCALPRGTRLHLGTRVIVELAGLRTPCKQIDAFRPVLLAHVRTRDAEGRRRARAGVMGVVLAGGTLAAGDAVEVELPLHTEALDFV